MRYPHRLAQLTLIALFAAATPSLLRAAPQGSPAAKPAREAPKPSAQVQALIDAGHKVQNVKPAGLDMAEKRYSEAADIARQLQDKVGESVALRNLGNIARLRGQAAKALNLYDQSLTITRATGNKYGEADTLYNIALLLNTSQPVRALEVGEQAQALYHELGLATSESQTLSFLGGLHKSAGQKVRAKERYEQAERVAHAAGDPKCEADALWYLATLVWSTDSEKALDPETTAQAKAYFQKALALYHKAGDTFDEAWTAQLLGGTAWYERNLRETQRYYELSLKGYRSLRSDKEMAEVLTQLSNVAALQERLLDSLAFNQEALDIYRKLGDKPSQALQLRHIADLYTRFGQQKTALKNYLTALPLFEQAGDVSNQVTTLHSIGQVYDILGDHKTAVEYFNKVLPLLEKPQNALARQQNLGVLAGIYWETGNIEKGRDVLLQQREELTKSGLAAIVPTASMLGMFEKRLGHADKAMALYTEALKMSDLAGNGLASAGTLHSIAEIEEEQGDLDSAEKHFAQAVAIVERVREALTGLSAAKSTFLKANLDTYRSYLALLLRRHKTDEAFSLVQKMKARSLLDILYDGKVQLTASLTKEERSQERTLRQKCDSLNYRLVNEGVRNEIGSMKRAEAIKLQIDEAERDLQQLEDRLYARHPDLAQKRAATTITAADVGRLLPEDTALLEYLTLRVGKTDEVVLFVGTQHVGKAVLTVHELPITDLELRQKLKALSAACSDPRLEYEPAANQLWTALIAPVEARLGGINRLIVCPDGQLWDTPFAALAKDASGGAGRKPQFLIDRFEIDYAYSGTGAAAALAVRAQSSRKAPANSLLAFANPNFGDEQRFGDKQDIPGQRPISAASRPISAASRHVKKGDRPISAASRDRPISAASRARPISAASRPISAASRPISAASREVMVPRGGKLSQLPGTLLEARSIRSDFTGARVYTGAAAQEATAKREAGKYRYLHFATHGFFNDAAPLLSAIVLALPDPKSGDDGFLTAREIFDLNLNADMVVLSACNTARGEKRSGEGIIGLTWALFAAGAPTQVVSQWSVNDDSTAALMQRFYANLTQKHMAKGAALRQAALSVRNGTAPGKHANPKSKRPTDARNPKWSHPYYWAPFILMGDWR